MESKKEKKGSQLGKTESSVATVKRGSVMRMVASLLKKKRRPILSIPKTKPIGNVYYTVTSTIEPVTFYRKKDALEFVRLLDKTTNYYNPVIIKREVTEEGYIPTYGEENV